MDSDRRLAVAPRVFFGLFVLALGVLFLLGNLGYVDIGDYWRWWPVIFIVIGLGKLLSPQRNRGAGLIFIVFGTWLLLSSLGYVEFDWRFAWPILLVLIGIAMIWRGFRPARPGGEGDASSRVHAFAMLGGVDQKLTSKDFRGGDATAILGGCDLDLSSASLASGEAIIDVLALWGGIDIKVPEDWTVVLNGMPIMGAFEDKRRLGSSDPAKRLIIRGVVIMGGVEIKN